MVASPVYPAATGIGDGSIEDDEDDGSSDEEEDKLSEPVASDQRELEAALDIASKYSADVMPFEATEAALNECSYAAAVLNLSDLEHLWVFHQTCPYPIT
jgi:hypothetical protein